VRLFEIRIAEGVAQDVGRHPSNCAQAAYFFTTRAIAFSPSGPRWPRKIQPSSRAEFSPR
jgi:hypothetical protein